jgi:hypothetical protein
LGIEKMALRKSKLIDLCVDGLITKAEFEKTNSQYDKQVAVLQKQWTALKLDNQATETLQQKLANIEKVIESIVKLREFSESVCGEILSKVIVEGRDKMSVYLTPAENKEPIFFKIPLSAHQYLLKYRKRCFSKKCYRSRFFNLYQDTKVEIFIGV